MNSSTFFAHKITLEQKDLDQLHSLGSLATEGHSSSFGKLELKVLASQSRSSLRKSFHLIENEAGETEGVLCVSPDHLQHLKEYGHIAFSFTASYHKIKITPKWGNPFPLLEEHSFEIYVLQLKPNDIEKVNHIWLYKKDGKIVSVSGTEPETDNGYSMISIGDMVTSNGNIKPKGLKGVVYSFLRPYEDGVTSDIVLVRWFDGSEYICKIKDFHLPISEPQKT